MSHIDRRKNIFIFSSVHPWNDVRIFHKQARTLAHTFKVELHAPAPFSFERHNGVDVFGLPEWSSKFSRIKIWIYLWSRLLRSKADLFHFHDPELIIFGLFLKVLRNKLVIYDVHENTQELIRERKWIPGYLRKVLGNIFSSLEKQAMNRFDRIILAEDSYVSFMVKNTTVVHNYPITNKLLGDSPVKDVDVVYVGGVMRERGAFEMIKIASLVRKDINKVKIKIIGPIAAGIQHQLRELIDELNLNSNVVLTGRMDYPLAMQNVRSAKIGLSIIHPITNYMNSLPTKLFEYMLRGVPFIASDFPYWISFFEKRTAGYFVPHDKPELAAQKIIELLKQDAIREQLGRQGALLARENFSWDTEANILNSVYRKIFQRD